MKPMRTPIALAAILIGGLLSTPLKAEDQKPADAKAAAPSPQAETPDIGRVNPKLESENYKAYVAKPGDSLWKLAKSEGLDFEELVQLNRGHLRNPGRIAPGDKIYLPDAKKQVAETETPAPTKPDRQAKNAPSAGGNSFTAVQKDSIRKIIREYLLQEPEVLREAIAELNKRQELAAEVERKKALATLYKEKSPYSTGNGKITLVEFFDYNCPYCRHALDNILHFTKEEKDVRVVFVEFPILSEDSRTASEAAIAAAKQNKYFEFHQALMQHQGPVKEDVVYKVAADVGLDVEKLKADMASPEVKETIEKNLQLGTAMGVQGTPAFFIGDEAIPGAPQELKSMLKTAVTSIREKGCSIC